MAIRIIPITANTLTANLRPGLVGKRVESILKAESRRHEKLLARAYGNWKQKDKPHWRYDFQSGRDMYSEIATTSTPWVFLEGGTDIRYRVMSRDWASKTRPKVLSSRAGAGRALGFGVKPGITAREWRSVVIKRRQKPLVKSLVKALRLRNITI